MERIIFHIDMNSFFASVEQQRNPLLRGKPIGVGGKPGTRSIIAAASREAKVRGVKGIMNAHEALKICPDLIIVDGDSDAYAETNRKFVTIFKRYTHLVEVFSIDECWLDMTGYATSYEHAREIAKKIKQDMAREIGPHITCSVGIAPNKLLAKLGSDREKPNGLFMIRPTAVASLMKQVKLDELLGIGPRILEHLRKLGITTTTELTNTKDELLAKEFGILGATFKRTAQGLDDSPVIAIEPDAKSIGNSYTMPTDSADEQILRPVLFALCEKIARRLRRHGCLARRFSVWGRYKNFEGGFGMQRTLDAPTNDAKLLLEAAWPIVADSAKTKPIRALGVVTHNVIHTQQTPVPLWKPDGRRFAATKACDRINDRFGGRTIRPAILANTRLSRHVSGFKHGQNVTPRTR